MAHVESIDCHYCKKRLWTRGDPAEYKLCDCPESVASREAWRSDSLPISVVEELKQRWIRLRDEAEVRGDVQAQQDATAAKVLYHIARGLERKG